MQKEEQHKKKLLKESENWKT